MTEILSNNNKGVDLVVEVGPDGSFDKLIFFRDSSFEEVYPDDDIKYVALSDGSLLRYDQSSKQKISVVREGLAFKKYTEKEDKFYSAAVTFDSDAISWILVGEVC